MMHFGGLGRHFTPFSQQIDNRPVISREISVQVHRCCLSAVNWSPSRGVEIIKTVETTELERVLSFSAREQVAYVHILWDGYPLRLLGEGQALSCSWFELDKLLLQGSWGLPTGVEQLAFPMVSALRGQELGNSWPCALS